MVGIQQGELVAMTEGAPGTEARDMVYVEQRTLILGEQIGLADWRESRHVSNGENANGIDGASTVIVEIILPFDKEEIGKEVIKEDEAETGTGKGKIDEEGSVEAGIDEVGIDRETDRGTTLGGMALYNS